MTMDHRDLTETFKFEYEDEIWRKSVFRVFSKSFILLFFNRKVNTVIFIEGGSALSLSQNDNTAWFEWFDNLFPLLRRFRSNP